MAAQHTRLALRGMHCASCVQSVEKALSSVQGVEDYTVNLPDRSADIEGTADAESLVHAIEAAGYEATPMDEDYGEAEREADEAQALKRAWIKTSGALLVGVLLMGGMLLGLLPELESHSGQLFWGVISMVTLLVMWGTGGHFFSGAWKALRHHHASMDTLIALGTGTAWLYSTLLVIWPDLAPVGNRHVYFEAAVFVIGLVNLGQALEARARGQASRAIKALMALQPDTAMLIKDDGETVEMRLASIQRGDKLRVRPGERIPVDGVIAEGETWVDESMLTGEPDPIHKVKRDELSAGTINQSGSIILRARKVGGDTALAGIIQQVRQAQNAKPSIGRLADRVSAVFVPSVMIIAIVTGWLWWHWGPEPKSAYMLVTAMTVLVIACPCALGLATPMSLMVGVGKAAEQGIIIRRGEALQTAASLDTIVLDKTGTITEGMPTVNHIECLGAEWDADTLLGIVAALEQGSEHSLAKAVIQAAQTKHIVLPDAEVPTIVPGQGLLGRASSHHWAIGNNGLMKAQQVDMPETVEKTMTSMASEGMTVVMVACDRQLVGLMGIADPIKADSAAAISRLQSMGLNVVMLTGDNRRTAEAVAKSVGIQQVLAEVMPDEKGGQIRELQAQGHRVGMVGDGINDAPALAGAEVGFAIGTGTDVAIESADMTLMRGSLHGVPDAITVAKATLRNIYQNLAGAFIYNALGIPLAAGILFPVTGWLLNPAFAGAAMAMSSVTVVTNANRLRLLSFPRHARPDTEMDITQSEHS
ncbi:copper-translocating P-type ATPase [Terasakiispira papahanaumokuakeensis]|uniref:Copper-exporting P-type ATPase n=1 Tax=Terasakiispira papahanaumokuakeensis TaxID=197479 RepID=A0A1E2V8H9_9GAMM|nr:heavy metal translocating P-type ATPase [Terasakiispira papahanaumokuakeensis]ODC03297.1 copper-translocating P-type ATPase [Terasakiispira papahanaumokuakeensis]